MTQLVNFAELLDLTTAPSAVQYPKLDEAGTYLVSVLEAAYSKTKDGTKSQGVVKVQVVDGPKQGARVNLYIGEGTNQEQAKLNIHPYYVTLLNLGIAKDKIIDDAQNWGEVIQSITAIMTKQIARKVDIKLNLTLKPNEKKSTPDKPEFYRNVSAITTVVASDPVAETKPATTATKASKAKVVDAPIAPEAESEDAWLD